MAIGYGAAGNPTAKKRKLPKVNTFRDMQNNAAAGPSKQAGPGFQPGGFGPGPGVKKNVDPALGKGLPGGATGAATGSGYTAPATPPVPERTYSEASQPPAAGGAPSPWFGAGALPSFAQGAAVDTGVGGLTEAGQQVPIGTEPGAPTGERGRGELTLEESMEGLDWDEAWRDHGTGPREIQPGVEGFQPTDAAKGIAGVAAEQAAGGLEARDEAQTLDQEMQGLIDEHEAGWGNTEEKLNAQLASAMRRQAEMNAAMGSSVAGGFAGATAATILGSLQVMADAYAAHQKEGRALQLAWLEKRMNMDFQREMSERETARQALGELLADPNAEVPDGAWEAAYGDDWQEAKLSHESGEGLPSSSGSVEGGDLKNAEGHFYMGADGLGTSGEVLANPYGGDDGDFTERQWFAEQAVDDEGDPIDGQYKYYYKDEDGNKRWFTAGVDGGAYPGDKRARNNSQFRYDYQRDEDTWEVDWGVDKINSWHRTPWGDENGVRINDLEDLAPMIMEMFLYEDPTLGANMRVIPEGELSAGEDFTTESARQAYYNFYEAHHEEVISYMFATYAATGNWPSGQQLHNHMREDLGEQIVIYD